MLLIIVLLKKKAFVLPLRFCTKLCKVMNEKQGVNVTGCDVSEKYYYFKTYGGKISYSGYSLQHSSVQYLLFKIVILAFQPAKTGSNVGWVEVKETSIVLNMKGLASSCYKHNKRLI